MRTIEDALRSVKKYLSQVLYPNPPLAVLRFDLPTDRAASTGNASLDAAVLLAEGDAQIIDNYLSQGIEVGLVIMFDEATSEFVYSQGVFQAFNGALPAHPTEAEAITDSIPNGWGLTDVDCAYIAGPVISGSKLHLIATKPGIAVDYYNTGVSLGETDNPASVWTRPVARAWSRGDVAQTTKVDDATWAWLLDLDRHAPVVVGDPEVPASYYRSSTLVADPSALVLPAGVTLTGDTVAETAVRSGERWEVRLANDIGDQLSTPIATVKISAPVGTSGPAHYHELTQPMVIECYPQPAESADEAVLVASRVQQTLVDGFKGPGVGLGRPLRVPLWDFDGVPLTETSSARHTSDFMRVADFSCRPLPDLEDPTRVRVVADLRVTWRRDVDLRELNDRNGRPVKGTRVVQSVSIEQQMT